MKDGVFTAKAALDGKHSGAWLCDLGASSSSLEGYYAKNEKFLDRKGVISMGHGAGAAYRSKRVECGRISFAGYTLKKPRIHFPIDNIDTVAAADKIGNLGNTEFRNFVLYVDYANEQMIVEQGDKFGMEFPEDRSGLQIMRSDNGGYEVWLVSEGTPAANAGFMAEDKLTSVNGIDEADIAGISAIRELLSEKAGTKYVIAITRGEKTVELKLTLADLF
ncbi:MAG: PDZ domain-containing protein [Candidatus Zixiibacteriota bacterium]